MAESAFDYLGLNHPSFRKGPFSPIMKSTVWLIILGWYKNDLPHNQYSGHNRIILRKALENAMNSREKQSHMETVQQKPKDQMKACN